jgi:hypothetical protein
LFISVLSDSPAALQKIRIMPYPGPDLIVFKRAFILFSYNPRFTISSARFAACIVISGCSDNTSTIASCRVILRSPSSGAFSSRGARIRYILLLIIRKISGMSSEHMSADVAQNKTCPFSSESLVASEKFWFALISASYILLQSSSFPTSYKLYHTTFVFSSYYLLLLYLYKSPAFSNKHPKLKLL